MPIPSLPLPEPQRGLDPHPFAHHTITVRFPKMVRRVLADHPWPQETVARLESLMAEIPDGHIAPIQEDGGPDIADWERFMAPYLEMNWLEAPWFPLETWFFRRILEATGYFRPGPGEGVDPYAPQKEAGLAHLPEKLAPLYDRGGLLGQSTPRQVEERLAELLRVAIWGNQADLSLWSSGDADHPNKPLASQSGERLLVDHAAAASRYLVGIKARSPRVDFLLDNVGLELAYDLALADFLLRAGLAGSIRFYAKPYPTYVSDATIPDVQATIAFLAAARPAQAGDLGERLGAYLQNGRLALKMDYFWTSPLAGWQMPLLHHKELAQAGLLVNKGDANYRRWLGDRNWPMTTDPGKALTYLPAPWLALRVCKCYMAVGLNPGQPELLDQQDPDWLTNGNWGMIQFVSN